MQYVVIWLLLIKTTEALSCTLYRIINLAHLLRIQKTNASGHFIFSFQGSIMVLFMIFNFVERSKA